MSLSLTPPTSNSFRDTQNFLVGANLVRKSTQLVNDLALINSRDSNLEEFYASISDSNITEQFDTQIRQSIEDIQNLREALGIDKPAGNNPLPLTDLLTPDRGNFLDQLT